MRSAASGGNPPVAAEPQFVSMIWISDFPGGASPALPFPVRVFAGDGAEVFNEGQAASGCRAPRLCRTPAPSAVEVVGENADADLGVRAYVFRREREVHSCRQAHLAGSAFE